jgi:hypothetical protein
MTFDIDWCQVNFKMTITGCICRQRVIQIADTGNAAKDD